MRCPPQALGAVFVGLAVWLHKNLSDFKDLLGDKGQYGVYACLALGACLALVAILGVIGICIRARPAGRCMLWVFALTMSLIVILEIAVTGLMFTSAGVPLIG